MKEDFVKQPLTLDGLEFYPISSKLAAIRLIILAVFIGLPTVLLVVLALTVSPWIWIAAGILLVLCAWLGYLIPRQIRAKGYATAPQDLVIRSGFMFRTLVSIPYGRIQYVDISEGPIERVVGLASVQLHTASATTRGTVKGLTTDQAVRLRDLLVANGVSELSGL